MWNDAKYLVAYATPVCAAFGLYAGGIWSPAAVYLGFVIIPIMELWIPARKDNIPQSMEQQRNLSRYFDLLLYLNLPFVYTLIAYFVYRVGFTELHMWEIAGMTLSMGVVLGTCGINVAHELGHRTRALDQWIARLLLIPVLYTHFTTEHNLGHHRRVGTYDDPATARLGESLYAFWWRSIFGSLAHAWQLERERLARLGKPFYGISNHLLTGLVLQVLYLAGIWIMAGVTVLFVIFMSAIIAILLLETVNYIEHYGLMRRRLFSGMYETVDVVHSWNSNHELGRIFLYELTRHADHHYRTDRHYQILRHMDGSSQLPTGYPGSMLLALVPGLWKKIMHKRIPAADNPL